MSYALNTITGNYRCEQCGLILPGDSSDLNLKLHTAGCMDSVIQKSVELSKKFIVPKPTKTLKLEPRGGESLGSLTEHARDYLNSQTEYTKIEFKFDRNYIVVAKLKD